MSKLQKFHKQLRKNEREFKTRISKKTINDYFCWIYIKERKDSDFYGYISNDYKKLLKNMYDIYRANAYKNLMIKEVNNEK